MVVEAGQGGEGGAAVEGAHVAGFPLLTLAHKCTLVLKYLYFFFTLGCEAHLEVVPVVLEASELLPTVPAGQHLHSRHYWKSAQDNGGEAGLLPVP